MNNKIVVLFSFSFFFFIPALGALCDCVTVIGMAHNC